MSKSNEGKRSIFLWINILLLLYLSGCSTKIGPESQTVESKSENVIQTFQSDAAESLIKSCYAFYRNLAAERNTDDLELLRSMVDFFGENGYAAVDSGNQVDMAEYEQVLRFCERAKAEEEGEITIIEVVSPGRFVRYDLHAADGKLHVVRAYYKYEDGDIRKTSEGSYMADYWDYTEDGYLVFSGVRFSEQLYVLTMSGVEEHTALRVQPLDEACRELNRQYLLPVGYGRNNMFLTDWSEGAFGELDFYDLYDMFYPAIYAQPVPYMADDNLGVGAVYHIPADEFERVIMSFFNIDRETLRGRTVYCEEDGSYEYKPRGFYEAGYTNCPYPEVVSYTENSDGTIAMTVHVVFPHMDLSRVYAHEVVVRPMADGGVQYISNRVMPSENNQEGIWYAPRLNEEEWEELYGSVLWHGAEKGEISGLLWTDRGLICRPGLWELRGIDMI